MNVMGWIAWTDLKHRSKSYPQIPQITQIGR